MNESNVVACSVSVTPGNDPSQADSQFDAQDFDLSQRISARLRNTLQSDHRARGRASLKVYASTPRLPGETGVIRIVGSIGCAPWRECLVEETENIKRHFNVLFDRIDLSAVTVDDARSTAM